MPTLGIWTPSAPAPALFPRRTRRAVHYLRQHGWQVRTTASFAGLSRASAASPEVLADELHELIRCDEVSAVMAATGGWTSALVLPHLDYGLLRAAGKPLIGYSDLTTVLWTAYAHGAPAIHGPMLVSEFGHVTGPFAYSVDQLRWALSGLAATLGPPARWSDDNPWWDTEDDRPLQMHAAGPWRVVRPGRAQGPLLAGCLLALTGLFGTPYMPDTGGHIVFLEDCGIAPDQFLALLAQWQAAGRLASIAALVIGRHSRPLAAPGGYADFDDALLHVLGDVPFPVLADVDFGHTEPKLSLPLGRHVTISTEPLSIHVGAA